MIALDTSVVIDLLLGSGSAKAATARLKEAGRAVAPDVVVFETLAVLRREVARNHLTADRAAGAVDDLGDLALDAVPSGPLRHRAWSLRENMTVADALFVATAEAHDVALLTTDEPLARATQAVTRVAVEVLG